MISMIAEWELRTHPLLSSQQFPQDHTTGIIAYLVGFGAHVQGHAEAAHADQENQHRKGDDAVLLDRSN